MALHGVKQKEKTETKKRNILFASPVMRTSATSDGVPKKLPIPPAMKPLSMFSGIPGFEPPLRAFDVASNCAYTPMRKLPYIHWRT
jgi:hypothetical protein